VGIEQGTKQAGASEHDLAEIAALVQAYATAADAGDSEGLATLFLPEGRLTTWPPDGSPGTPHYGIESIGTVPTTLALRYESSVHRLGELHVVVSDDGRTALGNLDCDAELVADGVTRALTLRYEDAYRRDADGNWRFVTRDVRIQSVEERPA
jgi:ketosteroid isomerase-like protein